MNNFEAMVLAATMPNGVFSDKIAACQDYNPLAVTELTVEDFDSIHNYDGYKGLNLLSLFTIGLSLEDSCSLLVLGEMGAGDIRDHFEGDVPFHHLIGDRADYIQEED